MDVILAEELLLLALAERIDVIDRRQLKARMKELGEEQWGSAAVRKAIRSIQAGVAGATAGAVAATTASSG